MFSLFDQETKKVVKELGKKDLKPVTSCHNSTQFRPFCLLRKKTRNILSYFWEKPPIPTDFSLMDILEPSSTDPELIYKGPFYFSDKVDGTMNAGVDVDVDLVLKAGVSGGAMMSHSASLKMQTLIVPHATWTTLQTRKLLKPEHSFLSECWSRGEDLYVVTEAVEVLNVPTIKSTGNIGSDGKFSFFATSNVKNFVEINISAFLTTLCEGQGQSHINKKKSLSIPAGSILAYRTVKLLITEKEWAILYILDDQKTFQHKMAHPLLGKELQTADESEKRTLDFQTEIQTSFQSLQEEVTFQKMVFVSMPGSQRTTLLCALHDLLANKTALQELEDMLDHVLDSGVWREMEGPGSKILSNLQDPSGSPVESYITGILYILGALAALNDTQHNLLAQSLEKKILPQQVELVKSILEANFNQFHECPFHLQPEFLSLLHGEDLDITLGLIEECGLKLQRADHLLIWDPEGERPLCALYGALSCLLSLAED